MEQDTIEQTYFEVKEKVAKPAALYGFMYKKDGTVYIDNMCVAYTTSDEQNIQRLRDKATMDGFMFFYDSEDGRKWVKENSKSISAALLNLVGVRA